MGTEKNGYGFYYTKLWELFKEKTDNDTDFRLTVERVCKSATDLSRTIIQFFPKYTMHDGTHIVGVCNWMHKLLGDSGAKKLSDAEVALLLMSACCHDIGMAVDAEEKKKLASLPGIKTEEDMRDYVRKDHHNRVREKLDKYFDSSIWVDSVMAVKSISKNMLADLCKSHGENLTIITSPSPESIKLIPCAVLLRLSDALDYDSNRAPDILVKFLGLENFKTKSEKTSLLEYRKTGTGEFTYEKGYPIRLVGSCDNLEIYNELSGYVKWLGAELKECNNFIDNYAVEWSGEFPNLVYNQLETKFNTTPSISGAAELPNPASGARADEIAHAVTADNEIEQADTADNQIEQTDTADSQNNNWDEKVAELFMSAKPPIIPSKSEVDFYKKYLELANKKTHNNAKVLIMGSTKQFVDLAKQVRIKNIVVVDSSETYFNRVFGKADSSVRLVNCDWKKMADSNELTRGSFDVILGDLALGHIGEVKDIESTIKGIATMLKKGGVWLGKNWFSFSQDSEEKGLSDGILTVLNQQGVSKEDAFAKTLYEMVCISCDDLHMLNFDSLYKQAMSYFDDGDDLAIYKAFFSSKYNDYTLLQKKGISFYVHDVKEIVKLSYTEGLFLLETGYGTEIYSSNFPLLVFQKGDPEKDLLPFKEGKIKPYISTNLLSKYQDQRFFKTWLKEVPSQYYVVLLCKTCGIDSGDIWDVIERNVISDFKLEVENGLASLDNNLNFTIADQKLKANKINTNISKEADHIKSINSLSETQKNYIFENYKLAVLYYLTAVFKRDKSELYGKLVDKIKANYEKGEGKCWAPAVAPWITAKMCSAASHVAEEQPDSIIDEMFVDSINWLIDSYKPELHNWEVNVGSKLDTLSLCVDAIMCFFDKLSASMQYAAFATVFQKILEYYILNDNIYETIAKHPLGRYAFDRIRDDVVSSQKRIFSKGKLLPSTHSGAGSQKDGMQLTLVEIKNKEQDEPYQKKVLGAIALYSSLVRIIAFTQKYNKNHEVSQEDNKSYESYKDLIIQKLKRFLAIFFDKDTSIIPIVEKINKIDTCMVPQIMYFIIQSFNEAHRALEDD